MPEEKVKQYECLCPCEHETGCIACENGNHDYHIVPPAADAGPRQSQAEKELSNSIRRAGEAFNWDLNAFFTHVKAERAKLATAPPKSCHNCGKPMADTQVRCLFCDAYEPAAAPVPQEAAPPKLTCGCECECNCGFCVHCRTHRATAPDSAMRVASEVTERLKGIAHEAGNYDGNPKPHCDQCAHDEAAILDAAEALEPHSAALIREAGSERERGLEDALLKVWGIFQTLDMAEELGLVEQMAPCDGRDKALSPETIANLDKLIAQWAAAQLAEKEREPFEKPEPGEWIQPQANDYLMRCCDCGLTHAMDFRIYEGRVQFRAYRVGNPPPPNCSFCGEFRGHKEDCWTVDVVEKLEHAEERLKEAQAETAQEHQVAFHLESALTELRERLRQREAELEQRREQKIIDADYGRAALPPKEAK